LRNVTKRQNEERAEKNRIIRELEHKEYQLQQVAQRSIDAQEEERKRISRELHDGVVQLLSALKINLVGMLDDTQNIDQSNLDKAVDIVSSSIRELRRISLDLRPPMLDELGFVSTLYWLIDRFQQSSDLQVSFFPHSFPKDSPKQIELALFRVVQEALSNVDQHAQASQVRISMRAAGPVVELNISDDGIGFDPIYVFQSEDLESGIGLVSMRERIEALGGDIQVQSAPKNGTTIQIKVPIKKSRKT
jgi:two-component system NarL family sensor kinase